MEPVTVRLAKLRKEMKRAKIHAYFIPSTDAHQSEYVPACWQRRQWISGFSGSAGDVVITQRSAGLWTDGRYFLQAENELKGSGIDLFRMGQPKVPTLWNWVATSLRKGQCIGVDPRLVNAATWQSNKQALQKRGIGIKLINKNLVDSVWDDQPAPPCEPFNAHPPRYSGRTTRRKLSDLRKKMAERGAHAHVLGALDSIAWLFNIRGNDVPFNPVVISYAIVTAKKATLYVDLEKVPARLQRKSDFDFRPYSDFGKALSAMAKSRKRSAVWVDEAANNAWIAQKLRNIKTISERSPIWVAKAKKNATEIDGMIDAHQRDGVAMVRFFHWLEKILGKTKITEVTAAEALEAFRAEGLHYRGQSFDPIVGYAAHGAIIHYSAKAESASRLRKAGILLVDSGGQYLDGTTDITRTVLLGSKATQKQKMHFTRVLKGHIALSRARFPQGTTGRQLDSIARMPLWQGGLQYNHGTGHGVGSYLNVHEGPQSIHGSRCTGVPLEVGNILSNEPGYYREGAYGIRIENLVRVCEDKKNSHEIPFQKFDSLTLCPIDRKLIDKSLLDAEERQWLNDYHQRVYRSLKSSLAEDVSRWLKRVTRKI
jgi:Xaa-Pro aminopeptidase